MGMGGMQGGMGGPLNGYGNGHGRLGGEMRMGMVRQQTLISQRKRACDGAVCLGAPNEMLMATLFGSYFYGTESM